MKFIFISIAEQKLQCFEKGVLVKTYPVSTAKNGAGEKMGSECTPRGWHAAYAIIGLDTPLNSVFVARKWTGEIYTAMLAAEHPKRDWILTRIIQLQGLEEGRNKGGEVDSLSRFIYIHGTPDTTVLGQVGSRGCIRMHNQDLICIAQWVVPNVPVYIG